MRKPRCPISLDPFYSERVTYTRDDEDEDEPLLWWMTEGAISDAEGDPMPFSIYAGEMTLKTDDLAYVSLTETELLRMLKLVRQSHRLAP